MSDMLRASIEQLCDACGNERARLLDIVRAVQKKYACISARAMELIARQVGVSRIEVESVVSFYAFLSTRPQGKVTIRLCDDVIDKMAGAEEVKAVFEEALGIRCGETTPDGNITLERTPCIGICDQAPAALIDEIVVTELSTDSARRIVAELKRSLDPARLVRKLGGGNNLHPLVHSMVRNQIRKAGPVILAPLERGAALKKALALTPVEVIRGVKASRLRGRGGAGFPTGMKWEFTRAAAGSPKAVLCNADEGEPGTFKDRVILTEYPDTVFEGMTIAAYAIGARQGILYLRAEYAYLRAFLEHVLDERRSAGLLGDDIGRKAGFCFDIRIQLGAGAYVCGEETALISSCEGRRGDPKNRPPFPAQHGYLGLPTSVNNVETLCAVARIVELGAGWFTVLGSKGSPGTKLLSISGDCTRPGVYEFEFGVKLRDVLVEVGAEDPQAVQVGGPSGQLVGPESFGRTICYDDLATGGALMVFGPERDLLQLVSDFLHFFVEESCGYCTPCRVGNTLLAERVDRILAGRGEVADLAYLEQLGRVIKTASRCGLGQTSPNPVLSSLANFRPLYAARVSEAQKGRQRGFDLAAALRPAEAIAGRRSVHHQESASSDAREPA